MSTLRAWGAWTASHLRHILVAVFVGAALLLLVGTWVALHQWRLAPEQIIAVICLVAGLLLLVGATFFWLATGAEKTETIVSEGQIVLGTGAGVLLVL